jgi:hypothetical protein
MILSRTSYESLSRESASNTPDLTFEFPVVDSMFMVHLAVP